MAKALLEIKVTDTLIDNLKPIGSEAKPFMESLAIRKSEVVKAYEQLRIKSQEMPPIMDLQVIALVSNISVDVTDIDS